MAETYRGRSRKIWTEVLRQHPDMEIDDLPAEGVDAIARATADDAERWLAAQ